MLILCLFLASEKTTFKLQTAAEIMNFGRFPTYLDAFAFERNNFQNVRSNAERERTDPQNARVHHAFISL